MYMCVYVCLFGCLVVCLVGHVSLSVASFVGFVRLLDYLFECRQVWLAIRRFGFCACGCACVHVRYLRVCLCVVIACVSLFVCLFICFFVCRFVRACGAKRVCGGLHVLHVVDRVHATISDGEPTVKDMQAEMAGLNVSTATISLNKMHDHEGPQDRCRILMFFVGRIGAGPPVWTSSFDQRASFRAAWQAFKMPSGGCRNMPKLFMKCDVVFFVAKDDVNPPTSKMDGKTCFTRGANTIKGAFESVLGPAPWPPR